MSVADGRTALSVEPIYEKASPLARTIYQKNSGHGIARIPRLGLRVPNCLRVLPSGRADKHLRHNTQGA